MPRSNSESSDKKFLGGAAKNEFTNCLESFTVPTEEDNQGIHSYFDVVDDLFVTQVEDLDDRKNLKNLMIEQKGGIEKTHALKKLEMLEKRVTDEFNEKEGEEEFASVI